MPEVDNFYLDANGILHKSTHGDAGVHRACPPRPAVLLSRRDDRLTFHAGEDPLGGEDGDMFIRMCSYIDTLVQVVRPRRLLYIAIDGVAPRAKMNQQRQRRYRVARERQLLKAKAQGGAQAGGQGAGSTKWTAGGGFGAAIN